MSTADTPSPPSLHDLYSDHHGWLHGWLRRRLGCSHRAHDLVHDTFLRLLTRDETVAINEPRAFLTVVARRVLSNYRRREQLERAYLDALALLPAAAVPSAEESVALFETLVQIDRLLDGLPTAVRKAFLLAQLDGLSHAEIAAELDISISTVKRHLQRAGVHCYFALEME